MNVVKANRQLTIQDEQLSEMLAKGYSRIDEEGKIVQVGQATTLKEIKAENDTLKAELSKVNLENDTLKAELETLKADKKNK